MLKSMCALVCSYLPCVFFLPRVLASSRGSGKKAGLKYRAAKNGELPPAPQLAGRGVH